jgi:DNA modification methylase
MLKILHGDWIDKLRTLEPDSIDLTVTSPPYGEARTYGREGPSDFQFEPGAIELLRVTKPGGVVCWNVGDTTVKGSETLAPFHQAIVFKSIGFNVHDTMIWEKPNFAHPEKVRYHQLFEYVFVLSKGSPKTFNPLKDKKNLYAGSGTYGINSMREPNGDRSIRKRNIITEYGMRGNVWRMPSSGQEDICAAKEHPATMGRGICRDLILSWSNEGDTVLDPLAGSGTTGAEALRLARKAVLIEREPAYWPLIEQTCHVTPGLPLGD